LALLVAIFGLGVLARKKRRPR
jgi:hypothetical protein